MGFLDRLLDEQQLGVHTELAHLNFLANYGELSYTDGARNTVARVVGAFNPVYSELAPDQRSVSTPEHLIEPMMRATDVVGVFMVKNGRRVGDEVEAALDVIRHVTDYCMNHPEEVIFIS